MGFGVGCGERGSWALRPEVKDWLLGEAADGTGMCSGSLVKAAGKLTPERTSLSKGTQQGAFCKTLLGEIKGTWSQEIFKR